VSLIEFGEPVSEDVMIAAFAKAEVNSPRYGREWQNLLLHRWTGRPRSLLDHPDVLSIVENNIRRDLLSTFRGYPDRLLFQGLPSDVVWYEGWITRGDVGDLLYARFPTWQILSGGTRLVKVGAANVDKIGIDEDGTNKFIHEAESLIALDIDLGKSILVSTGRDDTFVILEGHARATGPRSTLTGFREKRRSSLACRPT
jgi:hypothetical protein